MKTSVMPCSLSRAAIFSTCSRPSTNRAAVDAHVAAVFLTLTRDEAAARLRGSKTAYGFVNGVAELSSHPALRRITVDTPAGPVAVAAPPAILSDGPRDYGAVPAIGSHTAEIAAEFTSAS